MVWERERLLDTLGVLPVDVIPSNNRGYVDSQGPWNILQPCSSATGRLKNNETQIPYPFFWREGPYKSITSKSLELLIQVHTTPPVRDPTTETELAIQPDSGRTARDGRTAGPRAGPEETFRSCRPGRQRQPSEASEASA